jgi:hypothetical protein
MWGGFQKWVPRKRALCRRTPLISVMLKAEVLLVRMVSGDVN